MRARLLSQAFSRLLAALGLSALLASGVAGPAFAAPPEPGGINLQQPATPIMEEVVGFHNFLLILTVGVAAFVLLLLLWVMIRFNSKVNPTPAKFSHNTAIEVVWTLVPVIILLVIAVPSFRLLYNQDVIPDGVREYNGRVIPAPEVTIKATGQQWSWMYEYPDSGDFFFVSGLLPREEADPDMYLLQTTEPMVAPADTTVRMQVIGSDVIHNWAMPAFGIKMDAIPGRLNETWFYVEEPGTYYGQCSELCGKDHAYMPIQVEIVPRAVYDRWAAAKTDGDNAGAAQILAEFKIELEAETRLAAID